MKPEGGRGQSASPPSLTACLSYYREEPEWLYSAVKSLALIGATDIVAADGGYKDFPNASPGGDQDQVDAIRTAAEEIDIDALVLVPDGPWDTEMQKRGSLFALSESRGADWHVVLDADEVVAEGYDLKPFLADYGLDAAIIHVRQYVLHGSALTWAPMPLRKVFRAIPGLTVKDHHANYIAPDGRRLWGSRKLEPANTLEGVLFNHLSCFRSPDRLDEAKTYYKRRDELGLERI